MPPHKIDVTLSNYAKGLIRFKAWQLIQKSCFRSTDRDDIEGDLWLALTQQSRNYDSERASPNTFIDRVVNSAAAMLLRAQRRKKRAGGLHAQSLDAPILEHGESSLGNQLGDDDRNRRSGHETTDPFEKLERDEAMEYALNSLPADLLSVCRKVMGGSLSSAARELGMSRRQIRNKLAEATAFFDRAGFE